MSQPTFPAEHFSYRFPISFAMYKYHVAPHIYADADTLPLYRHWMHFVVSAHAPLGRIEASASFGRRRNFL